MQPYVDKSKGELALNIDLDVLLWLESRDYHKLAPLRSLDHLGFVVVNEEEMKEFESFRHKNVQLGSSIFRCNHLLNLWLLNHKEVSQHLLFGAFHVCLKQEQVDDLCKWVLELRGQVGKKGRQILDDLAQHHDDKVRIVICNDIVSPYLSLHGTNWADSISNTN